MATLGTNNPFIKLMVGPGDIRVMWPTGYLATDTVMVGVIGYNSQWIMPHNIEVLILIYSIRTAQ